MFDKILELLSTEFGIGLIAGLVIVVIGIAFYIARRIEEN